MNFSIFVDLDGTILTDDKRLTERTKNILRKIDRDGNPVILTSGRTPQGVLPLKHELGIKRPVICFGGGLVLDEKERPILEETLSFEDVTRIDEYVRKNHIRLPFNFYTGKKWYTTDKSHPMEQFEIKAIGFEPEKAEFRDVIKNKTPVYKCLFTGFENEIDNFTRKAVSAFPSLKVLKTQYFICEIMKKTVSKAMGIKRVLDYYGIERDKTIGIGDSPNDLEMLEYVKFPVFMKNADESLKPGRRVTKFDNNEDGAAIFLSEIFK